MNFVFKFDPDPKFDPKNAFLNFFFKLVILPVLLSDFKCSTVCWAKSFFRQHACFQANIQLFGSFKSQYGYKYQEGYDHIIVFQMFWFKGPKTWKKYMLNSHTKTDCHLRPNLALYIKVEENIPQFFRTKWGSVFSTFWSKARFGLKMRFIVAQLFHA